MTVLQTTSKCVEAGIILPCAPEAAALARRYARVLLETLDEEQRDALVLLVSEVVTNSVIHAQSVLTLRCWVESGRGHVEVHDRSRQMPVVKAQSLTATSGRGMDMLDLISSAWGVRPEDDGKTVWFQV